MCLYVVPVRVRERERKNAHVVFDGGVAAEREQEADELVVAALGGPVESGPAALVARVLLAAARDQPLGHLAVPVIAREDQRREARLHMSAYKFTQVNLVYICLRIRMLLYSNELLN